jgi:hexosaminidase
MFNLILHVMKSLFCFVIATLFLLTGCKTGSTTDKENVYSIIPAPLSIKELPGNFVFGEKSKIILSALTSETRLAADFLALLINNPTGLNIPVETGTKAGSGSVIMLLDTAIANNEGYNLTISRKRIIVRAKNAVGLFYAVQTIRQLLPPEIEKSIKSAGILLTVPCCEIKDEPRFIYRGMHLDVARHIFPVEYVKRYIDMMALHKMNTFHWHLTDDQGWRIEIKKYPRLTEVGGFRKETLIGHGGKKPFQYDKKRYGGFYTQEEVRDIVAYAGSKFITVIPEIEMPGHAMAALASYPELACTKGPFTIATRWGIFDDVFCAGKENTFKFLEDVLTEVITLFPGKYIHIGGDECPKTKWKKCPLCQARIRQEGLKDENELQSYFIRRIEKFIVSKDRKLIGWDEILEGGLAPEATVMSWRGIAGGIEAAKQGHDVIMTPGTYLYLDKYQAEPKDQPLAIGGYLPLEKVYSYDPLPPELIPAEKKFILGPQGNLWSEYLITPEYMEYMAYPRMFAVSEVGWTSSVQKDFEDFIARLEVQKRRYDLIGINYFKGDYRNRRQN